MRRTTSVLALVICIGACTAGARGDGGTSSTTSTQPAQGAGTATTVEPSSTSTSSPAPVTTESATRYDIIVAGDGLGAVAAAVTAGRRGHAVALLSPTGYVGGQAGSAGVTSFDDASGPARDLFRSSGIYAEFFSVVTAHYAQLGTDTSRCYFSDVNTFCPEPHVVKETLESWLTEAGVDVIPGTVIDVDRGDDATVIGVTTSTGATYRGLVIDATEFGDVIPLTGAAARIGDGACVQDMTHSAVMAWYPNVPSDLVVPEDAHMTVADAVGAETVDAWLASFRALIARDGQRTFTGWRELSFPIDPSLAAWYRGMPDSRDLAGDNLPDVTVSAINLPNDVPVNAPAVEGGTARTDVYRRATLKTYLFMWYQRWELQLEDWAVATHLGYDTTTRLVWLDEIPDEIERHLPPGYYVREARRLAEPVMRGQDIATRGIDVYPDSGFLGGDRSDDDHGDCAIPDAAVNPTLGPYDAPIGLFIPVDVDGFLVGVARNGRVDRSVASSIRMHAPEMLGGEVVGVLASLAVERGIQPRDVPIADVRSELTALGAIIDVP